MTEQSRPDPLQALREAMASTGPPLPDGLLEEVLSLETEGTAQNRDRLHVQATLRGVIEQKARTAS